ncbi:MAG: pseudaminic acid synthase [Opitutae bacterium]|nr:pseudaminic acid synthase [Opitutae bacterium]
MNNTIKISTRLVGAGHPAYVIAEMSANHNQDFNRAVEIVQAAKAAGADAVKLQTYSADAHTIDSQKTEFKIAGGTAWDGQTLYGLYRDAYMPWDWQPKLQKAATELGLDFFSAPVDATSLEFLETLAVPVHKIASFELVDLPLVRRVAQTGKPAIMSTGMASLAEIDDAVRAFRQAGGTQLALLKCTSAYPSLPEEMNLRTIPHLAEAFGVPAGLSDHTLGIAVPVAAVALGACIVEKHFTLSRAEPGPDSAFSLEPAEFKAMVEAIRMTEKALGSVNYRMTAKEEASRVFRRSLFVVQDVKAGELLTAANVRSIRPGCGLPPKHWEQVIGRKAARDIERGTPLDWSLIAG